MEYHYQVHLDGLNNFKLLNIVARDFIKLPTLEELPSLSEDFFDLASETGTVLVVDCSFILINKPSANGTKYFLQENILRDQCSVFCGFQEKLINYQQVWKKS